MHLRQYKTHSRMLTQMIFCLSLCLLLSKSQPCFAQQKPLTAANLDNQVIKIDVKAASLDMMITLLGEKLHAGIVVDDRPHHTSADFTMETTPRKAFDRIADAFDYSWKLTRNGMVMLYKRFKDPTEFPQMDLAEWEQMSKDVIAAMDADTHDFSPDGRKSMLESFVRNLSVENVRLLRSHKPVKISGLEERQLVPLREYLYQRAFSQAVTGWITLRQFLPKLNGVALQMLMRDDPFDWQASQQEHRPIQQILTLSEILTGDDGKEVIASIAAPRVELGNGVPFR